MKDVYNINVGVLGHVDSGKTSLVAALSDILSVAALDKHPQSQERGITLDIGFSAFTVPCPAPLQEQFAAETLQFTLVDCPGHASLLKTVLVGAQIIDMMLLVVDATKGVQTQTAECVIVGELLSQCAVVALNKTDLFPPETRQKSARRAGRSVVNALRLTRFAAAEIVPVAAKVSPAAAQHAPCSDAVRGSAVPGDAVRGDASRSNATPRQTSAVAALDSTSPGGAGAAAAPSGSAATDTPADAAATRGSAATDTPADAGSVIEAVAEAGGRGSGRGGGGKVAGIGIDDLKAALLRAVPQLHRDTKKPLLFMADHCFAVKGHGTVLSGTVLQGSVARGDTVELPDGRLQRKVKSLQCFKQPCARIAAGDRAGMCLAGVPPAKLERTFVSAPGLLKRFSACVCMVQRCRFYTGPIKSRQKVFITAGNQTCMAAVLFFGLPDGEGRSQARLAKAMFTHVGKNATEAPTFDSSREYLFQDELYGIAGRPFNSDDPLNKRPPQAEASAQKAEPAIHYGMEWAVLVFDRPLLCLPGSVIISTKFDLDLHHAGTACRIAFYGNVAQILEDPSEQQKLKMYRLKFRKGVIDRITNDGDAIVKDMFKKDSDLRIFKGNQIVATSGATGEILGSFGSSGKVRVSFLGPVQRGEVVTMRMKKPVPCKLSS
eukprot:jgi/Ulvmu1/6347/UM029_0055.1